jgi:phosphatidylinositol glycan class B
MGLFAWYAFVRQAPRQHLVMGAFGFLLMIAAGLLVDRWFYGEWVATPWNYVRTNLVEGRAAEYGTTPWYQYVYLVFRFAFFPVGSVILISTVVGLYLEQRGPLAWAVLPFLLVHSALAHKELRFLFPLAPWVPYLILRSWGAIAIHFRQRPWVRWTIGAWWIVNTIAVLVASMTPQATGRADIMAYIQTRSADPSTMVYTGPKADPYDPWNGLVAHFYRPNDLRIRDWAGPSDTLEQPALVILERRQWETGPMRAWAAQPQFHELTTSYTPVLRPWLKLYGGINLQDELIVLGRR